MPTAGLLPRGFLPLLPLLPLLVVLSCGSPTVTSGGIAVTNQVLITGSLAVHVAEVAASTVADALTSQYQAGRLPAPILQQFQAEVAPRVTAALIAARLALQTLQATPTDTTTPAVLQAVLVLQAELTTLQSFATTHLIVGGNTP